MLLWQMVKTVSSIIIEIGLPMIRKALEKLEIFWIWDLQQTTPTWTYRAVLWYITLIFIMKTVCSYTVNGKRGNCLCRDLRLKTALFHILIPSIMCFISSSKRQLLVKLFSNCTMRSLSCRLSCRCWRTSSSNW